jgi:sterol desaturase/sphingolipid hydroxylase (fatty acid hydroxylase superfamily)
MPRQLVLDFLRLCLWLLILAVVFIPLERLCALRRQDVFRKRFVSDLFYYFFSSMLPKAMLIVPMALAAYAAHRVIPAAFQARAEGLPVALRFVLALAVAEVGYYWGHRWSHEIPLLWRFHAIHHSAEEMDWLVNTRAHPVDMVFTRLCGVLPIYVLGLSQPSRGSLDYISLLVILVSTLWGFFIHANLRWRLGPVEWLLAGPAFHHWHHTAEEPLNRNFSPMLPLVDRLFGTYYSPKGQWPARYGTDTPVPEDIAGQLVRPFAPPSWSDARDADRAAARTA